MEEADLGTRKTMVAVERRFVVSRRMVLQVQHFVAVGYIGRSLAASIELELVVRSFAALEKQVVDV